MKVNWVGQESESKKQIQSISQLSLTYIYLFSEMTSFICIIMLSELNERKRNATYDM